MRDFAFTGEDLLTEYYAAFREFGISYPPRSGGGTQMLEYCPWCGSKLPTQLRDQWFTTVQDDPGFVDAWPSSRGVPLEFKSDQWWRKRKL
jgi:hypothetical protein